MMKMKSAILAAVSIAALSLSMPSYADDVLAKVNGEAITSKDLKQLEKALPPEVLKRAKATGGEKGTLINQLVDLKVLTDAAKKSDISKKAEVKKAMERAAEQVIVQAFVFEQLKSKVNEKSIEEAYAEFSKRFKKETKKKSETKFRHILVKTEEEAKAAIKKLGNGEDFIKLARDLSIDKQSGQDGGDLGYILEGTVKDFDEALKAISVGKFSKTPTKTQFGFHVFKVDDRRKPRVPAFKDVKQQLTAQVQQKAFVEMVKRLRDKANVEIIEKKTK